MANKEGNINKRRRFFVLALTLLTIFTLRFVTLPPAAAQTTQPADGTVFALAANNTLLAFNPLTPGTIMRTQAAPSKS